MKYIILLSLAFVVSLSFSCKKDSKEDSGIQTPFEFTSLNVSDTIPVVNAFIDITATAKGDDLLYTWSDVQDGTSLSWGTFVDKGDGNAQWTVCHSAKFIITCKVEDKHGNSAEKSVAIHVQ